MAGIKVAIENRNNIHYTGSCRKDLPAGSRNIKPVEWA